MKLKPKIIDIAKCITSRYYKGFSNYNPENAVVEMIKKEEDIIEKIEEFGNKNSCYKPHDKAVCYPIYTQDFVRTGFLDIAPTLAARDYKDPKWVIEDTNKTRYCVAMRGRYNGDKTEQRLELQKSGCTNTLTGVQKDNLIIEKDKIEVVRVIGGLGETKSNNGTQYYQQDRVYSSDGVALSIPSQLAGGSYKYLVKQKPICTQGKEIEIASTILNGYHRTNMTGFNADNGVLEKMEGEEMETYRIRKLTPKECWRLMGFTDEEFDRAEKVSSNTQLYKQAGNSIVVDVLAAIIEQIFEPAELSGQLTIFDLEE